ncbi:hypothetical protein ISCGN_016171, partial [Ixodes scapularis]
MSRICRTSDSAKSGSCRNFEGKFGKDSAKIQQMSERARERDGGMDCKWTPNSRAVTILQFSKNSGYGEVRSRQHGNSTFASLCECGSPQYSLPQEQKIDQQFTLSTAQVTNDA